MRLNFCRESLGGFPWVCVFVLSRDGLGFSGWIYRAGVAVGWGWFLVFPRNGGSIWSFFEFPWDFWSLGSFWFPSGVPCTKSGIGWDENGIDTCET